jgi:glycosyltransferase involved in cell wall biosynthesis
MKKAVTERLKNHAFELIICDEIYQLQNVAPSEVPVVLNKDGVVTEIMDRYLAHERNALLRACGRIERGLALRLERRACASVNAVLTCSERDSESLLRISPHAQIAIAPNSIDTEYYLPAATDDGATIMFVGAMDWAPNRDAINFFVRESLPRLLELAPHARLVVVGRNPPADFTRHFEGIPAISFTGTVPDPRPLLARAAVTIVPLRIGSGTRMKILEAAAMAKPAVSTTIGAEGLAFARGTEIILADDPVEFAKEVADLLHDKDRRRAIGDAARRLAVQRYSIPALTHATRIALAPFNQT